MRKLTLVLLLIGISVICQGQNRFDKTFKKTDSAFNHRNITIYFSNENYLKTLGDYNFTKVTIESNGKFTINLDGFKVTDTIWIQAGKKKVPIPAYKFLEYFKDEPISGGLFWNGNRNIPTLNQSTLEYHMIK